MNPMKNVTLSARLTLLAAATSCVIADVGVLTAAVSAAAEESPAQASTGSPAPTTSRPPESSSEPSASGPSASGIPAASIPKGPESIAELETILQQYLFQAQQARSDNDLRQIEQIRLKRFELLKDLKLNSPWVQGAKAVQDARVLRDQMKYDQAIGTLFKAWQLFPPDEDSPNLPAYGDIVHELFITAHAALAIYDDYLADRPIPVPEKASATKKPSEKPPLFVLNHALLSQLLAEALQRDPCQVELQTMQAYHDQEENIEAFRTAEDRQWKTRFNRMLLDLSAAKPHEALLRTLPDSWSAPAEFLKARSISQILSELDYYKNFLDIRFVLQGSDARQEPIFILKENDVFGYAPNEDREMRPSVYRLTAERTWRKHDVLLLEISTLRDQQQPKFGEEILRRRLTQELRDGFKTERQARERIEALADEFADFEGGIVAAQLKTLSQQNATPEPPNDVSAPPAETYAAAVQASGTGSIAQHRLQLYRSASETIAQNERTALGRFADEAKAGFERLADVLTKPQDKDAAIDASRRARQISDELGEERTAAPNVTAYLLVSEFSTNANQAAAARGPGLPGAAGFPGGVQPPARGSRGMQPGSGGLVQPNGPAQSSQGSYGPPGSPGSPGGLANTAAALGNSGFPSTTSGFGGHQQNQAASKIMLTETYDLLQVIQADMDAIESKLTNTSVLRLLRSALTAAELVRFRTFECDQILNVIHAIRSEATQGSQSPSSSGSSLTDASYASDGMRLKRQYEKTLSDLEAAAKEHRALYESLLPKADENAADTSSKNDLTFSLNDIAKSNQLSTLINYNLLKLLNVPGIDTIDLRPFGNAAEQSTSDMVAIKVLQEAIEARPRNTWQVNSQTWRIYDIPALREKTVAQLISILPMMSPKTPSTFVEALDAHNSRPPGKAVKVDSTDATLEIEVDARRTSPDFTVFDSEINEDVLTITVPAGILQIPDPAYIIVLNPVAEENNSPPAFFDDGEAPPYLKLRYNQTDYACEYHHDPGEFRINFNGLIGVIPLLSSEDGRRMIDSRGNTITRSSNPTRFFDIQTPAGTLLTDPRTVYTRSAYRDLDQNIVNTFMPDAIYSSISVPLWYRYSECLQREVPEENFRWVSPRSLYLTESGGGSGVFMPQGSMRMPMGMRPPGGSSATPTGGGSSPTSYGALPSAAN